MGSGFEERNARWAHARRSYNAGYGIRSLDDLHSVIAFFEERRGRLHGFRWKDHVDWKSCAPEIAVAAADQVLGAGDGSRTTFQLCKRYGALHAPYERPITKPVAGSVRLAVDGVEQEDGVDFDLDATRGTVTFQLARTPAPYAVVTAGFEFDVPVRFDTDRLDINLAGFRHGAIPAIPLVEIRI